MFFKIKKMQMQLLKLIKINISTTGCIIRIFKLLYVGLTKKCIVKYFKMPKLNLIQIVPYSYIIKIFSYPRFLMEILNL
jgi:hypothetical protein